MPIRAQSFLRSYAFLPDSRSVLCLDVDGTAMVRNAITGEAEERLTQLGTNHNAVAVSPDGRWLVLGCPGPSLSVWDRLQRFVVTNTTVQAGEIWALCFDTPGRLLRVTTVPAPDRATIRLLVTRDWREVDSWDMESWDKWELAWSPEDRLVAFGDRDGTVSLAGSGDGPGAGADRRPHRRSEELGVLAR